MTGLKLRMPCIPRFETVNVPPASSAGVIVPFRARSIKARLWVAISVSDVWSASKIVGTMRAAGAATTSPMLT